MKNKKILFIIIILLTMFSLYPQDNTDDISDDNSTENNTNTITNTEENDIVTTQTKKKNGWDLYQEGRYYDSIIALKKEMINFPNRINIYVILGWNYLALKNFSEMENISKIGIQVSPSDVRVIKNLAEACYYQGKYNSAINYMQKYLQYQYNKNDPYLNTAYYYLGVSFYYLKYYRKADIALLTSNYYKRNDIRVLLKIAETKEKLNDNDKAAFYYQEVIKLQPENNDAINGLERIKNKKSQQ